MKYDVAIVGASISGLYCAYALAKRGHRVCVVDRREKIGEPVRCGEATGTRAELARFVPISEEWIARDLTGLAVHLNDSYATTRTIENTGLILHRDLFEKNMANLAMRQGAEIRLNTAAVSLRYEKDTISGVNLADSSAVRASIIVGADGAESRVGQWAGLIKPLAKTEAFTSLQYRITSDFCNDGYLHFFIGSQIIPHGYLWVFPRTNKEISVGAGLYGCHYSNEKARYYLDAFIQKKLGSISKTCLISGCAPITLCPKNLHRNNVVVVGDAARQVNPFTAGGIMNALEASDLAVKSISRALKTKSTFPLARYSRIWRGKPRFEQKLFLLFQKVFLDLKDSECEALIQLSERVFSGPIDRSIPFRLPLSAVFKILVRFLPAAWRHRSILSK